MKVVLDNIIYSNVSQGGVSNYWYELSRRMMEQQNDLLFYEEPGSDYNFHRNLLHIPATQLIPNQGSKSAIRRKLSPVKYQSNDYFLYHSSYYRPLSGSKNFCEVTTVHDFTHNFYSGYLKRFAHNRLKYSSIRKSDGIICISENTLKDLKKFCPIGKNQKAVIIHNGVSDEYKKIDKDNPLFHEYLDHFLIDQPFLIFVGGRSGYKNFSFTVQLLKEMPNFKLVVIGSSLTAAEKKLFDQESLARTVVIGDVSNTNLNTLYNFAEALIYPSSYEGFGIPVLEAMRAGCPVLALDKSSIKEVSGGAALLFKELNRASFKLALTELKNTDFKTTLTGKGLEHAEKFSWDRCFRETHEFYQEIYKP